MEAIFTRSPINRTAASVTSQSGCASDDTLSEEQLRENMVAQCAALIRENESLSKHHPKRKANNARLHELQTRIHEIRPKRKCPGIENHFIDAAREMLSRPQFSALMRRTAQLQEQAETGA